jgi:hypothetical protein
MDLFNRKKIKQLELQNSEMKELLRRCNFEAYAIKMNGCSNFPKCKLIIPKIDDFDNYGISYELTSLEKTTYSSVYERLVKQVKECSDYYDKLI